MSSVLACTSGNSLRLTFSSLNHKSCSPLSRAFLLRVHLHFKICDALSIKILALLHVNLRLGKNKITKRTAVRRVLEAPQCAQGGCLLWTEKQQTHADYETVEMGRAMVSLTAVLHSGGELSWNQPTLKPQTKTS